MNRFNVPQQKAVFQPREHLVKDDCASSEQAKAPEKCKQHQPCSSPQLHKEHDSRRPWVHLKPQLLPPHAEIQTSTHAIFPNTPWVFRSCPLPRRYPSSWNTRSVLGRACGSESTSSLRSLWPIRAHLLPPPQQNPRWNLLLVHLHFQNFPGVLSSPNLSLLCCNCCNWSAFPLKWEPLVPPVLSLLEAHCVF